MRQFEDTGFIIPYEEARKPGKSKIVDKVNRKPEIPFILENANFPFNRLHKFKYQFAPVTKSRKIRMASCRFATSIRKFHTIMDLHQSETGKCRTTLCYVFTALVRFF
jgi:hypothetical protein